MFFLCTRIRSGCRGCVQLVDAKRSKASVKVMSLLETPERIEERKVLGMLGNSCVGDDFGSEGTESDDYRHQ